MDDNEYTEYIDNEQLCKIEGIPCKYGIPCCEECSTACNKKNQSLIMA